MIEGERLNMKKKRIRAGGGLSVSLRKNIAFRERGAADEKMDEDCGTIAFDTSGRGAGCGESF